MTDKTESFIELFKACKLHQPKQGVKDLTMQKEDNPADEKLIAKSKTDILEDCLTKWFPNNIVCGRGAVLNYKDRCESTSYKEFQYGQSRPTGCLQL